MSHETDTRDPGDVGPGFMDAVGLTIREGIARYVIGFVLACALTAASFYVLNTSLIWGPGIPVALVVLAVAQISVHLVFFLHITNAARWRLAIDDRDAFTSTPRAALIVAIDRGVRIAGAKNFWLALEHPLRIRFANFSLLRGGGSEKQISMAPK